MTAPAAPRVLIRRLFALAAFICTLWIVQAVNWATDYQLNLVFGLIPREAAGLDGIVGMPFLHGSFEHLISNTLPLCVMGALLVATATRALLAVNAVIIALGGALVWLFGSAAIHIGASGLVFGWFGFLLSRGFIDRSLITLGVAAVVGVIYGTMVWGVLPGRPGVSWEAHLFGAIAGGVAALLVRTNVHGPRVRDVDLD